MKKIYLISIFILVGTSIGLMAYAFTGPGQNPPNGTPDFWIKPSSIMYYTGGNVGIGQTTATEKFEVTGNIKATGSVGSGASGLCINGDCKTSWASVATPSGWTDGGTSVYLTTATDNVGVGTGTVDTNYKITTASGGIKAESTTQPAGYFNSTSGYGLVVNTGNVGIGDITPTYKLTVAGTTNIAGDGADTSGTLRIGNGSSGAFTVVGSSATGDVVVNNANTVGGDILFQTRTTDRLIIKDTGYVGIGTTAPSQKLEVVGNVSSTAICLGGVCNTTWPSGLAGGGTVNYVSKFTGTGTLGNSLLFDNGTNVGVGTATPAGKLDIAASTGRQVVAGSWSDMSGSASGYGLFGGNMYQDSGPQAFKYSITHANIGAIGFATNYPSWNKASVISSGTTSATAGTAFTPSVIATFDYAGNVGIGTTAPVSKLSVGGAGIASTGVYGTGASYGVYGSGSTGVFGTGTSYGVEGFSSTNGSTGVSGTGKDYGVSGSGNGTNSTGVYGVGTGKGVSGNGNNYGVYGTGGVAGVYGINATGNGVYGIGSTGVYGSGSGADSNGVYGAGDTYGVYGYSGGTAGVFGLGGNYGVRGSGTVADFYAVHTGSGNAAGGAAYASASSIRWKENITPIPDALGKIMLLNGVYFDWKKDYGGQHDMGMIAEDVRKVVPEIVAADPEAPGYDIGLDYSRLTPILVEAVKSQQKEIDDLKLEIKMLKK